MYHVNTQVTPEFQKCSHFDILNKITTLSRDITVKRASKK
jgi:hypothetical protein